MKISKPLLSVIVPCYNVEKYVDKCISSIVGQTYSNLEVILIDDGSTDNTGNICDSWQKRDQRIRVIHKQNEGLPYARKTGIEQTTADYVTFVDADDWIDKNMYSDMMAALLTTNSDVAQCELCFVYEDGRIMQRIEQHTGSIQTFERIESVIMLLEDEMWRVSFCTKIYKKSLFEHITFPKGRTWGEDYVNLELFHQISQSVFIDSAYYFYFQRNDSMTKQGNLRKEFKNISDKSDAYHDRYVFVERYPEYHSALPYVTNMTIGVIQKLLHIMVEYPQYFTNEQFDVKSEQLCSIQFTKNDKIQIGVKIDMFLLRANPKLYKVIRHYYHKLLKFKKDKHN